MSDALRDSIEHILQYPHDHEWSTQGFGMLRMYLDKGRKHRLNVWHASLRKSDVSTIHDHPWDFESSIICGSIRNTRYIEVACELRHCHYSYATIKCGPGGGMVNCEGDIDLHTLPSEYYFSGDTYSQKSNEVHESYALDGTVTLITRAFHPDTEHARVFWKRGGKWVDAEPTRATEVQIYIATTAALEEFRAENNFFAG
jgi:hypothetical protein